VKGATINTFSDRALPRPTTELIALCVCHMAYINIKRKGTGMGLKGNSRTKGKKQREMSKAVTPKI